MGYDHRFGKDRAGNFENLQELANEYSFFLEKEVVFEEDDVIRITPARLSPSFNPAQ